MVKDDEGRNVSDKETSEKYVHLEKSYISDTKNKEVIDMLYGYNDAFSLRDEIGTCLNIELEIDFPGKSTFFIRPYHVKGYKTFPHIEIHHIHP